MTELEKAARQALEAFEDLRDNHRIHYVNEIVDLRQALEAAERYEEEKFKPDWMNYQEGFAAGVLEGREQMKQQPAAQWVGLTEDEVAVLMMEAWGCASIAPRNAPNFARAIEAKLREKNGGKA